MSTSAGQAVISQVLQAASTVLGMAQDDLSPTVTSSVVDIVNTLCQSSPAIGVPTNISASNSTSLNTGPGSPLTRATASHATALLGIVARLNVANAEAAVTSSADRRRRLTSTSQSQSQSQSSGSSSAGDGAWVHSTVSTIASAVSATQALNAPTTVSTVGSEADGSLLQVRAVDSSAVTP